MPKCTILIGVPGSGKSTWYDKNKTADSVVISTDNIITFIGQLHGFTYNEIFKDTINLAEKIMWRRLEQNATKGNPLVIDRTNLTAKSRKRFIDYLKPYGYEFDAVVFETPEEEEWKRRLNRPGKTIPLHVLESMADNIEIPLMSEGFATILFNE